MSSSKKEHGSGISKLFNTWTPYQKYDKYINPTHQGTQNFKSCNFDSDAARDCIIICKKNIKGGEQHRETSSIHAQC